jgi:hypothetical protein
MRIILLVIALALVAGFIMKKKKASVKTAAADDPLKTVKEGILSAVKSTVPTKFYRIGEELPAADKAVILNARQKEITSSVKTSALAGPVAMPQKTILGV